MKSIADLNGKWWYRLLKVLYGCFFVLVALISGLFLYFMNDVHYASDWKVKCLYGNQSTFNAQADKGISMSAYNPYDAVPAAMDSQIKNACAITQADMDEASTTAAALNAQAEEKCMNNPLNRFVEAGSGTYGDFSSCNFNGSVALYTINATEIPIHTPISAMAYTILDLLIVFGFFELGRRAFYYITLGKIKPSRR